MFGAYVCHIRKLKWQTVRPLRSSFEVALCNLIAVIICSKLLVRITTYRAWNKLCNKHHA